MLSTVTQLKRWFGTSQKFKLAVSAAKATTALPATFKAEPPEFAERLSIEIVGDPSASTLATSVSASFRRALMLDVKLPQELLDLQGASGKKYRLFINDLVRTLRQPHYLEIGSSTGSALCAAIYNNSVKVACIKKWNDPKTIKNLLFENIGRFSNSNVNFTNVERDFLHVNYSKSLRFNLIKISSPLDVDCINILTSSLSQHIDDEFVFIIDDWNASAIREVTTNAIKDLSADCLYQIFIRTTQHDEYAKVTAQQSDWHNGVYAGVYRKRPAICYNAAPQ